MVLVPEVVDTVGPDVPVLAAGGIGRGRQMAAAIALGAQGAWTGSIWLAVAESAEEPWVVENLLEAGFGDTVRSRSMTGKPAAVAYRVDRSMEREDVPEPLPMPLQGILYAPAAHRFMRAHSKPLSGSPVGQIIGRVDRVRPARRRVRHHRRVRRHHAGDLQRVRSRQLSERAGPDEHAVPEWFVDVLAHTPEHVDTEVDGVLIHYRRWGAIDQPGLVLVHGGAAHSGWWDHVAPLLAGEYCVVALDLSGHGDSGRRDTYDMETWAREVIAVATHSCFPAPPIIVAHSMGGWVGITVAAAHGDELVGLVLLDSMVARPDPEVEAARSASRSDRCVPIRRSRPRSRTFAPVARPTHVVAVRRRPCRARSLRETTGGWTWKFDPRIFESRHVPTGDVLQRVTCRVSLFRAEHGLVSLDIGEYMYEQLGRIAPIVEVPLVWHHIMLDQPIALVTGFRALLADWEHSRPHRHRRD